MSKERREVRKKKLLSERYVSTDYFNTTLAVWNNVPDILVIFMWYKVNQQVEETINRNTITIS